MTLDEIKARKQEILERSKDAAGEELEKLTVEMTDLNRQETELRAEQADAEKRSKLADMINEGKVEAKPIEEKKEIRKMANVYESMEYRQAFMDYVLNGTAIPAELRGATSNDVSVTSENSVVIPATTLNQIIEKMDNYGNILPLVKKLAYPAGVVVPYSSLATEGRWIAEAGEVHTDKKATASITFGAFQLGCAISVSFKAHIQSLSAFEAAVVENVSRAMVKALENAIINGDGDAKPLGILSVTHTNTPMTPATIPTVDLPANYAGLINMLKAIPTAYSQGSVICVNESTFYDLIGIVDTAGQPVARVNQNISGAPSYSIMGKPVIVTDYIPAAAGATAGDKVGFIFNFDNYVLNTAYSMDLVTYVDNATRNRVYQSMGMYDGKVVDGNGLVFLTKPSA